MKKANRNFYKFLAARQALFNMARVKKIIGLLYIELCINILNKSFFLPIIKISLIIIF